MRAARTRKGCGSCRRIPAAWAELMAVVDAGEDPEGIVKLPSHS